MIYSRWRPPLVALTLLLISSMGFAARDEVEEIERDLLQVREIDTFVYAGNETDLRKWLDASLQGTLDEVSTICSLTDKQREKLELAGKKDASRFFDALNAFRNEFAGRERTNLGHIEIFEQSEPLRLLLSRGLFNSGSLFEKILPKVLSEGQIESWSEVQQERRAFRYLACVERVVMLWDSVVPFRAQQRKGLVALLTAETEPPLKFGPDDYAVVVAQAAQIPAERFLAILDRDQWRALEKGFRHGERLRGELQRTGVMPVEEPAATE